MNRKPFIWAMLLIALLVTVGLVVAREIDRFNQTDGIELSAGYQRAAFPGEMITFEHTVRNLSHSSTHVTLSVVAEDPNWTVDFIPVSESLDAGETMTFELTVQSPVAEVEGVSNRITVNATGDNPLDRASAINKVQILARGGRGYLPIIARNAPTIKVQLKAIENFNGDGEYVVRWSCTPNATRYIVEEATAPSFSDATVVYAGSDLSTIISGKSTGYYYYRVREADDTQWSAVESTVVIPFPGIFGVVTYDQIPIPGIALDLQCYNGVDWYTADTATTGDYGIYVFDNAPTLDGGEFCYVNYGPNNTDSRYLYLWANYYIYYYVAGTSTPGGSFDIANVALGQPDSDTIAQAFPVTFYWTPRSMSPDDSYELRILDNTGEVWSSGQLGYVGSHTLPSRPSELADVAYYGWDILVYGRDGIGISYETHDAIFDEACIYIENDTCGDDLTFYIHGMASVTVSDGTHLYGCFPPNSYTYTASTPRCGSVTDTDYFPIGSSTLTFSCECPPPRCVYLYIQNDTGSNLTFCLDGWGCKSMPPGRNLYNNFPAGCYNYSVSANCGSLSDRDCFSCGPNTLRFYCGAASSNLQQEAATNNAVSLTRYFRDTRLTGQITHGNAVATPTQYMHRWSTLDMLRRLEKFSINK